MPSETHPLPPTTLAVNLRHDTNDGPCSCGAWHNAADQQPEADEYSTTGPFPFFGPVAGGDEQNPAAHGGVCYRDEDPSGLYRLRLVNGAHEEIGPWMAD